MSQAPTGPYHAGPGTAHEIGVMIGFMAAFVLVAAAYLVIWRIKNKRSDAKEVQRRRALDEKMGSMNMGVGVEEDEKAESRGSGAYSAAAGY